MAFVGVNNQILDGCPDLFESLDHLPLFFGIETDIGIDGEDHIIIREDEIMGLIER